MVNIQSIGDADIWTPDNFSLRKSARLPKEICHTQSNRIKVILSMECPPWPINYLIYNFTL